MANIQSNSPPLLVLWAKVILATILLRIVFLLLSKTVKINIYRTIILPVTLKHIQSGYFEQDDEKIWTYERT